MVHILLRILGWLLTPLVAWAASFLGSWIGTLVAGSPANPMKAFWITFGFGAVTALVAAWAWLRFLRKHPFWQRILEVAPDGTPLIALDTKPRENAP